MPGALRLRRTLPGAVTRSSKAPSAGGSSLPESWEMEHLNTAAVSGYQQLGKADPLLENPWELQRTLQIPRFQGINHATGGLTAVE